MEYTSPPKRVILGDIAQNSSSPISPMANLKLLTKVATGLKEEDAYPQHSNNNNSIDESNLFQLFTSSRRTKSLGFICLKFLQKFPLDLPPGEYIPFSLSSLAADLHVEKRRIYDIINVVSSLQMAVKIAKDRYHWYGNQKLIQFLGRLKGFALLNNFDGQVKDLINKYRQKLYLGETELSEDVTLKITNGNDGVFKENRIGVLCQKFIMLFLVSEECLPLNLLFISKLILTKDIQGKTGMRRLYDIANVLEALKLVKKHTNNEFKKPTFVYCGPLVDVPQNFMPGDINEHFDAFSDTTSESSVDLIINNVTSEINGPPAKKRLLFVKDEEPLPQPSVTPSIKPPLFVKAPASSFTLSADGITTFNGFKPSSSVTTPLKKPILIKKFGSSKLSTSARIIRPIAISDIQNGGIYKAIVSNNNMVQFVKL